MKFRIGFVSNSSSTSYVLWGMNIEWPQLKEDLQKKLLEGHDDEYSEEDVDYAPEEWEYELEGMYPILESHYGEGDWSEGYDFGRSFVTIKDDETGKKFKESIEKILREILKDDVEVKAGIIDVCYRDG